VKTYKKGIGYKYLSETKYFRDRPFIDDIGMVVSPPLYKAYPHAQKITLPAPDFPSSDLWKVIARRRSYRDFTRNPLTSEELAILLWAGQGITSPQGYRTAPSAGALYPIETYLVINRVQDIPAGIYHFNVANFFLEELAKGDFSNTLTSAALGQSVMKRAAVVFVWTAVILRCMAKYRNRAIRYIFLDAGHICQNILLAATALNLGACPVGAFFDEEIDKLLGLNSETEMSIYLTAVGKI